MALNLSQREPQSRQRIFAAHAKDTQMLQQMVSVLTTRAGRVPSRERGIQGSGLIEEGQLYAVCMQEMAAQISVHSPALSELAGQLFHGFVGLFQRSLSAEEARLNREREAHTATRVAKAAAESDTAQWKAQKEELERRLNAERRKMEDKERLLAQLEKRVHEATTEAHRMRQQLEQYLGVPMGKEKKKMHDEVMGSALEAMGTTDAGIARTLEEETAEMSEAESRKKTAKMVDRATDRVRQRVTDIESFLGEATKDAEVTGRAADYLQRMVRTFGAVNFEALESDKFVEAGVQTDDFLEENVAAEIVRRRTRRRSRKGSSADDASGAVDLESPVDRILRLSRARKLRLEGSEARVLPPRIACRTVMQLMLDKASRGRSETLPEFMYNFYLHMYGVRRLAEQNLIALVMSCAAHAASFPRLATFSALCGVREEPTPHAEADAELVCNMYAGLSAVVHSYNSTLTGGPSWLAENRLPLGDDGSPMLCPKAQCAVAVTQLFEHVRSLHTETFDEIVGGIDELSTERGKGRDKREVVDADALIAETLNRWQEGRAHLREQVSALFTAGDVNGDGVLSYDEFAAIVRIVLPSATDERIWSAFRDCIEASNGSGGGGEPQASDAKSDGAQLDAGIQPESFVSVIETHGLLGACLSAATLSSAQQKLLQGRAPLSGSSRNLTAHIVDGGASDAPNPGGLRRRGGLGASLDEHAQLRMDLLQYEWTESVSKIEAQIGDLREQLKGIMGSSTNTAAAQEGDQILKELEPLPAHLEKLSAIVHPPTGRPPVPEDVAHGWEQYRFIALKISRLASRVADMKHERAPEAAATTGGRGSKRAARAK